MEIMETRTLSSSVGASLVCVLTGLLCVLPGLDGFVIAPARAQTVYDMNEIEGDLRILGRGDMGRIDTLAVLDFDDSGLNDFFIGGGSSGGWGDVYGFLDYSVSFPNQEIDSLYDKHDIIIQGPYPISLGHDLLAIDINGDSLQDLVTSDTRMGYVYVFYGSSSWTSGTVIDLGIQPADLTIIAPEENDYLGKAMAAGDLNADGIRDLALGAVNADNPAGWSTGAVYVINGSHDFPPHSTIDLQAQQADITIYGKTGNNDFGNDLAAGDVNADGICDLVIGAYIAESDLAGRTYVFYGSDTLPPNYTVDLRFESLDITIKGPHEYSFLGFAVTSGDINGDGIHDILTGARYYHGSYDYAGRAYAIFGRANFPQELVIDLAVESADLTIEGETEYGGVGKGMSSGDMDGDGIDDWAIAGALGMEVEEEQGIAFLFQGSRSFPPYHYINLASTQALYRILGDDPLDALSVTSDMADVNGDGLADLVLGAYQADRPEYNDCGEIYVILGRRPLHSPPRVVAGPGPQPSNPLVVRVYDPYYHEAPIIGFRPYLLAGYGTVVAAGDLDGDGYDETLTGPGPGPWHPPVAAGFDYHGHRLFQFRAYGARNYGVNVAAGDIDADGREEILTGPGPGIMYGPHVRGWKWQGESSVTPLLGVSFLAYSTHQFGVNVAAGDIDGDGREEILTGPGPGSVFGAHVRGWKYTPPGGTQPLPGVSFLAYDTHNFGVNVAAGDIDGDGLAEILTAPGPGPMFASHIRGWNYDGVAVAAIPEVNFIAFPDLAYGYGAAVACADLDNDRVDEILTAPGPRPDNPPELRTWNYDGVELTMLESKSFLVFEPGLYRAAARIEGGNFYQYPPYLP